MLARTHMTTEVEQSPRAETVSAHRLPLSIRYAGTVRLISSMEQMQCVLFLPWAWSWPCVRPPTLRRFITGIRDIMPAFVTPMVWCRPLSFVPTKVSTHAFRRSSKTRHLATTIRPSLAALDISFGRSTGLTDSCFSRAARSPCLWLSRHPRWSVKWRSRGHAARKWCHRVAAPLHRFPLSSQKRKGGP
jgi:hypothetical protein